MTICKIEEVMTHLPHTIGDEQTLEVARRTMIKYGVRHLPVQKGGELVGVLSDRDINSLLAQENRELEKLLVKDALTPEPYVVEPGTVLSTVTNHMAETGIGCTLIAHNGKLMGIFTTVDCCRVLTQLLRENQLTISR